MCQDEGVITPATVCDHVEPHRGDTGKFWGGPFQSLCAPHHNREKQMSYRAFCWADGKEPEETKCRAAVRGPPYTSIKRVSGGPGGDSVS